MWGKNGNKKATNIRTLIGQGTELRGDLKFTGGILVNGTIQGNIFAESDNESFLELSEHGVIEGDVKVPNLLLDGRITGDVYASEHIQLAANARVKGNVYYKVIEMARGAEVNGSLIRFEDRKALPHMNGASVGDEITQDS